MGAFLYDSDFASAVRILAAVGRVKFATDVLHPHTIAALTALLEANNHYVAKYRRAFEHLRQNPTDTVYLPVDLSLVVESSAYLRRYNLPTVNEVAAIVQALVGEDINSRCIALRLRNDIAVNSWDFIICMQPVYLPLRFVLLSPDGQSEWYPEMELQNEYASRKGTRLTQAMYFLLSTLDYRTRTRPVCSRKLISRLSRVLTSPMASLLLSLGRLLCRHSEGILG